MPFKRGIVGMARRGDSVDTANSQFFFMFADGSSLNGQYTVIGEVVSGMDVVDKLKKAPPGSRGGDGDRSRQDGEGASRIRHQVSDGGAVRQTGIGFAAALLLLASVCAQAEPARVDNIREAYRQICSAAGSRRRPRAPTPIDITVLVSFNRDGAILGRPKITYESEQATDNDRLLYRIAVMEALQRCTPMPFTESMGGAIAGRPFAIQFRPSQNLHPNPQRREHG